MMTTSFSSPPPPPSSTSRSLLLFPSSHLKLPPRLLLHGRSTLSCSAAGTNNGPPPAGDSVPKQVPFCPFSSFMYSKSNLFDYSFVKTEPFCLFVIASVTSVSLRDQRRSKTSCRCSFRRYKTTLGADATRSFSSWRKSGGYAFSNGSRVLNPSARMRTLSSRRRRCLRSLLPFLFSLTWLVTLETKHVLVVV